MVDCHTVSPTPSTRSPPGELDDGLLAKLIARAATQAVAAAQADGATPADCPIVSRIRGQRVAAEALLGAAFVQPNVRLGVAEGAGVSSGCADGAIVGGAKTPPAGVWRVAEVNNALGLDFGLEVKLVTVSVGVKGIYAPNGKDAVFVEFSGEEPLDFTARLAPREKAKVPKFQPDVRALSVKCGPSGRMRRWGFAEHETLLRIIELAGQRDQLDISNLACMEASLRRVQTIGWACHDKIRETDAGSSSRLSIEEATAFSGLSRSGDLLMVAPSYLERAKAQVEKDAAITNKNIRKAKEERELRRNQKDKPGKKQGTQRLVIDCRPSNCWFSPSDPVELSAGAALGNIEKPAGATLYVGHVDIKDAFYHFLPARAGLLPARRALGRGASAAGESCWRRKTAHKAPLATGAERDQYLQDRLVRAAAVRRRRLEFLSELDQRLELNGLSARPRPSAPLDAGMLDLLDLGVSEWVTEWVTEQCLKGVDHWRGANPMAALASADPRLSSGGRHLLPQARQASKGWRNLAPAASRLPLPAEVVSAIAMELLAVNCWDMAMCAMLSLAFLMRPGDWKTVGVDEASLPSKTEEFDESLLLDLADDQWPGPLRVRLIEGRGPQEPLFSFSKAEFARLFKMAGARLLLQRPPPPCVLRHSGASRDFAEQRRSLAGVNRRGRWRTDASARRYEKGGRLGTEFATLKMRLQVHARWCLKYLLAALHGSLQPRGFRGL
ncbi:unnamed protein product [Prorocentrum cordatum]|uniref:Uncharacterized protein n=1 Tax=Prorocentrum cordatum TaxID=2364126 RepID=A0ABN9VH78_9DINO|nr:unnamed protein product [Polarella glacialis]